ASILAGCSFAFGGSIGVTPLLDEVHGAVLTPLIFLFLFRSLRDYRPTASIGLFGLSLGIACLSGHHEIPLLTSFFALGVSAYGILRQCMLDRGRALRLSFVLAIGFVIAGMVGAVQILPSY